MNKQFDLQSETKILQSALTTERWRHLYVPQNDNKTKRQTLNAQLTKTHQRLGQATACGQQSAATLQTYLFDWKIDKPKCQQSPSWQPQSHWSTTSTPTWHHPASATLALLRRFRIFDSFVDGQYETRCFRRGSQSVDFNHSRFPDARVKVVGDVLVVYVDTVPRASYAPPIMLIIMKSLHRLIVIICQDVPDLYSQQNRNVFRAKLLTEFIAILTCMTSNTSHIILLFIHICIIL